MPEYTRNKPTAMDRFERDQRNYIATEMSGIIPAHRKPETVKVKFRNPDFGERGAGDTKWLNITQAQYQQIERILTLGTQGETNS